MSIKATFPAGVTELTVHGLHQWDYGQKLEIQAPDLPALVEVHFACAGMRDAVVRACSVTGGTAQAAIPDQCLEQTSPIVAWVFVVDETAGTTVLTVTLPIAARTQPQPSATVPEEFSNKYTELIAAVNEQVEALKVGNVTVNRALNADEATHADAADEAGHADTADEATHAGTADTATKATTATTANKTYGQMVFTAEEGEWMSDYPIDQTGVYLVQTCTSGGPPLESVLVVDDLTQAGTSLYATYNPSNKRILPVSGLISRILRLVLL